MTGLDNWLKQATCRLSADSAAQVQTEIREHYQSALEAAITGGAKADAADRLALTALGDAKTANRQYRRVLLTAVEAKMLRQSNREARAICSRPWLKAATVMLPIAAILASVTLFRLGATDVAPILMIASIGFVVVIGGPFLPVYTLTRSRVYRALKWAALFSMVVLPFGASALQWSWLLATCLWPMAFTEWVRFSIRRKLPVAQWPKQLYL
jgi:hypothetical protein